MDGYYVVVGTYLENNAFIVINYFNESTFTEIGRSFVERENGTIYNHHEYINTVRIMVNAFKNNDKYFLIL